MYSAQNLFDNFFYQCKPQLREFVKEKLDECSEGDLLTEPLKTDQWYEDYAYRNAEFWFDSAEMPLKGWISVMDCLTGDREGDSFAEYLRSKLKVLVFYEMQNRKDFPDEQRILDHEFEIEAEAAQI